MPVCTSEPLRVKSVDVLVELPDILRVDQRHLIVYLSLNKNSALRVRYGLYIKLGSVRFSRELTHFLGQKLMAIEIEVLLVTEEDHSTLRY